MSGTKAGDGTLELPAGVGKTYRTAASYSIRKPLVVSDGNALIISASATIRDTRPNLGYVWAVHVFLAEDAGHELALFEHWFEGQPVEVNGDKWVDADFFQWLPNPLPPGRTTSAPRCSRTNSPNVTCVRRAAWPNAMHVPATMPSTTARPNHARPRLRN